MQLLPGVGREGRREKERVGGLGGHGSTPGSSNWNWTAADAGKTLRRIPYHIIILIYSYTYPYTRMHVYLYACSYAYKLYILIASSV